MPQRARDREALHTSHPVEHYRDDRAIEVGRQKLEHPKDRRRSKGSGTRHCSCGWCDWHDRMPIEEYRRSRGGQPLQVTLDDVRVHQAEGGFDWAQREKRAPGQPKVDLWDIARPGRIRRDLPKGYEVVPRPMEVIPIDDWVDSEWESEDFEFVELPVPTRKAKGRAKSFAQAVKGKRKER